MGEARKRQVQKFSVLRLRKNWCTNDVKLLSRVKESFSNFMLELAAQGKLPQWRFFDNLNSFAKRERFSFDNPVLPAELDLVPVEILYSDLYFVEDFDKLSKGMKKMLAQSKSRFITITDSEKVSSWIDEGKKSLGGGWINAGWVDFRGMPKAIRPALLSEMHVQLIKLSPSIISIAYAATPSELFSSQFEKILREPAQSDLRVGRWHWRRGLVGWESRPARARKAKQFEDLFLSANAELVRVLRFFVQCGLAMKGPLKEVDVFCRGDWESQSDAENEGETLSRKVRDVMSAVGHPGHKFFVFKNDWLEFYSIDRRSESQSCGYQIIVKRDSFNAMDRQRSAHEDLEHAIRSKLAFSYTELAPLISVEAFYRALLDNVFKVRDGMHPVLTSGSSGVAKVGRLRRAREKLYMLNALLFKETVVWNEYVDSWTYKRHLREIDVTLDAVLEAGKDKRESIASMFGGVISRLHQVFDKQMDIVRPSYNEIIGAANVELNHRLQILVLLIAVLGVLLALPADTLQNVFTVLVTTSASIYDLLLTSLAAF